MTAEITILNKSAVALAADSAVTLSLGKERKVFNTVNKVFRLSLVHPVGIMIYGGASLMNVPWETIIKLYRKKLDKTEYPTLNEYVKDFLDFLVSRKYDFFPQESQEKYIEFTSAGIVNDILGNINNKVQEEISKKKLTHTEIIQIASGVIENFRDNIENLNNSSSSLTKLEVKKLYGNIIERVATSVFQKLKPYKKDINLIIDLVANYFTKDHYSNSYSGIVFAGFGEKDIYPKMISHKIEGVINNKLRFSFDRETNITAQNGGEINRFAQGDMVSTFIEGIDPSQRITIDNYIHEILKKYPSSMMSILEKEILLNDTQKQNISQKLIDFSNNLYKDFIKDIHQYRGDTHVTPVLHMVSILPKEELATMAETFVNITSFKQRVSMSAETVGGPIDVAIITKGDGFIWVKRKPSFDKNINSHI